MAKLTFDKTTEHHRDHTLEINDGDRIKIAINGEDVTYMRCKDGQLAYMNTDQIEAI